MQSHPELRDREDAGRRLASALSSLREAHPLILALPRGGVPVAFEVARALRAPLDLLFVRKLGVPGRQEVGMGAVVDGATPQVVLNAPLVRDLGIPKEAIDAAMRRQLAEIDRQRRTYAGNRAPLPVTDRTVIVVDDGVATGVTTAAALQALRRSHAARVVLATPVAPPDVIAGLRKDCDAVICLEQPEPFHAVGAHYANFDQVPDSEVIRLLAQAGEFVPKDRHET